MKKLHSLVVIFSLTLMISCTKEYSEEYGSGSNSNIVGADCRISKIVYTDSASGVAIGSVAAVINSSDQVTSVTDFDSLNNTLNAFVAPVFVGDTIFINGDEYFVLNSTSKTVKRFHGLQDPTNSASPKIDVDYTYDAAGYLIQKQYFFTLFSVAPYAQVDYTYTNGNLTHMEHTDLITGDLIDDADIIYSTLAPKNFMYLFADEFSYQLFNQFLNFGKKSTNAPALLTVNNYTTGNVLVNTSISSFSSYILSVDNYVLSCMMNGDDQTGIPAEAGKLKFFYKCK